MTDADRLAWLQASSKGLAASVPNAQDVCAKLCCTKYVNMLSSNVMLIGALPTTSRYADTEAPALCSRYLSFSILIFRLCRGLARVFAQGSRD